MGLRQFSMHPSQILPVKEQLFDLSTKDAVRLAGRVLRESDPMKIRAALDHRNPPEPSPAPARSAA
jgi:phosphoenolpyruvate-protein kinase (PTS system EI component)